MFIAWVGQPFTHRPHPAQFSGCAASTLVPPPSALARKTVPTPQAPTHLRQPVQRSAETRTSCLFWKKLAGGQYDPIPRYLFSQKARFENRRSQ